MTLYNDHDADCCALLRGLIASGEIPEGRIDERSIAELEPADCPDTAHYMVRPSSLGG